MEVFRRTLKRLKLWGDATGFAIVSEAVDGQDALIKLEADSYDLIITDIRMPKMDGIELLRAVSEKKLCPVAVLLSDFAEYNYAKQGFLYGAFDYLSKPVDEKELESLLERVKAHLNEAREKEEELKSLQGIAENKPFTAKDIKEVVALLRTGDFQKAILVFLGLMENAHFSYESDWSIRLLDVQSAMNELIDSVVDSYDWIEKYLGIDALKKTDYFCCTNPEEVKTMVEDTLKRVGTVIFRLAGRHENKIVKQVCEYTLNNIEENISVKSISEKLFINRSYLSEIFKKEFGITLQEYITIVKIERAKRLLLDDNLKAYEIAERLGYKDAEYFGGLFKKYTGGSIHNFND
jgi:two-component system response regulator YesN